MERHPSDLDIDAFIDGALDAAQAASVEAHLARCAACRAEAEALRAVVTSLRESAERSMARDDEFDARLRAALDREESRGPVQPRRSTRLRGAVIAGAVAAAALLVWFALPRTLDLPSEAAALVRETRPFPQERVEAAALQARFASEPLPFAPRVLDLRMMGWEIEGGEVARLADRLSTRITYRDAQGRILVCWMLEADARELPTDATTFREASIAFFAFTRGDITVVAWAEGGVLCFLAGALPPEDMRSLAVAKAMLPASRTP